MAMATVTAMENRVKAIPLRSKKMTIYYLLLAAVVILGIPLCGKRCGSWGKIVYCIICAVGFIIISAIRFEVGYDYNSYGRISYDMRVYDIEDVSLSRVEKGFLLPIYIINLGFEEYYVVFIYTSIIIYTAVFALICKRSEIPWISAAAFLCFGLFFNSLCFLRQFIAALIIAYAIKFAHKETIVRYLLLVIVASTFHWSALIMAVMYIFVKIKPSWIYLGIVTAGTVIFCIFSRSAMLFLIDKFYMYKSYDPDNNPEASMGLPPRYTIMFGIIFLICFLFRKKLIEKNPDNGIYINCLMFTVVFEAMGMRHAILSRFAILTYLPPCLFMLPDTAAIIGHWIKDKKGKAFEILSATAASFFAVGCYTVLMINNYNGVVPYVTQFNRTHDIFLDNVILEEDTDSNDEEDYNDNEDHEDYDEDSEEIFIENLPISQ